MREDGCEHLTKVAVAEWWAKAYASPIVYLSVCLCCGGPAPGHLLYCRKCADSWRENVNETVARRAGNGAMNTTHQRQ